MQIRKVTCMVVLMASAVQALQARKVVLEDFESYEIGQELTMWNRWGLSHTSRCVVESDPANANNKVLHVYLNDWNTYVALTLPDDLAGTLWHETKDYIALDLRRSASDVNDNKKFFICQGDQTLWSDGDDSSYPHQGDKNVWQSRKYVLSKDVASSSNRLALGLHSDKSDYFIDNVAFCGEYDEYLYIDNDTTIDFSGQNTSSAYKTFATPFNVPSGKSVNLLTARYAYFNSAVTGDGTINIYGGGERAYLGASDKSYPDWKSFAGDVHIYPYKKLSASNGFYGLVLMHKGKVMTPETAQADADDGKMNTCLTNSTLVLHDGATLAIEGSDKNRGARIGRLQMEAGSTLMGYYKSKAAANSYYLIGGTNDDAVLAGRIAPASDNKQMLLGLIKEGTGTYRITGNTNLITGGIRVVEGRVLFNNDAASAKSKKLSGSIGTPASESTASLVVMQQAAVGGTGHIAASTNLYGILQPGDDGIGQLAIADYVGGQKLTLIVRPSARLECQIASAESYDRIDVQGAVSYYNIMQDFSESDMMPRLRIQLAKDAIVNVGDEFTLFTAASKTSYQDVPWQFDVRFPKAYTWEVEQLESADGIRIVARVTSLDYSGQGELEDSDLMSGDDSGDDGATYDIVAEQRESTSLRTFADHLGKYVGTCVPVWKINVDNDADARTSLIASQFNAVVCENEMKFDATEPNRGEFSFGSGDQLINLANRHNLYVRGHTLAWHSQVPGWLTSDGTKNSYSLSRAELLAILKNHIFNVVGHWKGKIQEWDVANEVLDDNQTSINSNPKAYDLRPSVWATGIGEDFLDSAFVWAHQADPDAKLILNDYGVEGKGRGKSEALYNLATRLRNSGIPIDGVGLQCHLDAGLNYIGSIEQNIARYQKAGMLCRITELDLGIDNNSEAALKQQADDFFRLARIAMNYDNCGMLLIWGLTDDLTWRPGRRPLLYDAANQPKPAYWGVHAALRQCDGQELLGIESLPDGAADAPAAIFNLQGFRVGQMQSGQLYVQRGRKLLAH